MSYKSITDSSIFLVAPRSDERCTPVKMIVCDLQTGVVSIATFGALAGLFSTFVYSNEYWALQQSPSPSAESVGTVIVQIALAVLQILICPVGIYGAAKCKLSLVKAYYVWSIIYLVLSVGSDCSSIFGTYQRCDGRGYTAIVCEDMPRTLNEYIPLILHTFVWIYFVIVISAFRKQLIDSFEVDSPPSKHRNSRDSMPVNGHAVRNVV